MNKEGITAMMLIDALLLVSRSWHSSTYSSANESIVISDVL